MEKMRKPFQGVVNIIRFNWHYYVLSAGMMILLFLFCSHFFPASIPYVNLILLLSLLAILLSLGVSAYIYDFSRFYSLSWLGEVNKTEKKMLNIHAGFDETSVLLQKEFPNTALTVLDFYNPEKHTEISIRRARKSYPPFAGTITVSTQKLPVADNSSALIFLILAAHEIRNEQERIKFFIELKRVLTPGGKIIITEHLRDAANFLAYNIGSFHFHSRKTWVTAFDAAGLNIENEFKVTPFITTFILSKNGSTS